MKQFQLFLVCLMVFSAGSVVVARAQLAPDERATLEQQLAQLEQQIDGYEDTIATYQKTGTTLKGKITGLNSQITKTNLQIKAINLELKKLDLEIDGNTKQITTTEKKLATNRQALAHALQQLYEKDEVPLVEILTQYKNISGFYGTVHSLLTVQESLRVVIERINTLRDQLFDQQQALAERKTDQRTLVQARDSQRKSLEEVKGQTATLLTKTKGQEKVYQELLTVTKQTAAQIRSRIFQFLGGGQLSFGDAYKLAKFAGEAVGVRPALVLAVLDGESALGRNVGRCSYQKAMHPTRDIPIFLKLLEQLNISPANVAVSCANSDGAYGGAMGPAQFIPSTWTLYANRIQGVTGSNPPSPWRNNDAFAATALYLKDSGAGMTGNTEQDRAAAAKYYSGARWRRYLWTYGERVVVKARQFEDDILALNSQNSVSSR